MQTGNYCEELTAVVIYHDKGADVGSSCEPTKCSGRIYDAREPDERRFTA
jgi:hypothetical protein